MSQHAILSPSGSETWESCAKAAAMQKGLSDDSSEYSDEGTAAHLLGSTCLEDGTMPQDHHGRVILVGTTPDGWDGAVWALNDVPPTIAVRRTYVVDDELVAGVTTYVETVREYAGKAPILAEMRCSITHITGEPEAAGTSDAVIVLGDELIVFDLKYGMGVKVSAERNKQLMKYAHAVKEELSITHPPFKRVRLVISQPRISVAPSEWDCTVEELDAAIEESKAKAELALAWYGVAEQVQQKAARAYDHLLLGRPLAEGEMDLTLQDFGPSEDACRWCKAKVQCPAVLRAAQDIAAVDFGTEPPSEPQAPDDYAALGKLFRWVPYLEQLGKAVRAKAEGLLFESGNDPAVSAALGIKLVEGKRGARQWVSEERAEAEMKSMRLTIEQRCNLKLKSPPQIEKVLKGNPRKWTRLEELIVQKEGQPSVAPLEDKRPAWVPPSTADDFDAVATEESV